MVHSALRRFCSLPLLFLLAGFCGATLLRFAPGFGVDEREIDGRLSAESIAVLRGSYENERNLFAYYARYIAGVVSGDLGVSRSLDRPVRELLRERAPVTVSLVWYGILAAWVAGFGGALAALRWPRSIMVGITGTLASCVLLSLPAALIAILFLYWRGPLPLALG